MRAVLVLAAAAALLVGYLLLWPVPAEPVAWASPAAPGHAGAHAPNTRLAGLQTLALGEGVRGPEHVVVGPDGEVFVAVEGGRILRLAPDGSRPPQVAAQTGGRVLGFAFDALGRIVAADAYRGLLRIVPGGAVEVLASVVDGTPIRYANSVAVMRNGQIVFTDASQRFGAREWGGTFEASVLDILEQRATGRVLLHDPARGSTRVIASGLSFANGVALARDEKSVFVAETGRYRVWRVPLDRTAPLPIEQAERVLDNLPGYPDNLMRGEGGRIWVGLAKPRSEVVDRLAGAPFVRRIVLRLPRALWPVPPAYGHVLAFDESTGAIVADLQDPAGAYPETTGVTEAGGRLWLHSLHAPVLGWMAWTSPVPAAAPRPTIKPTAKR